MSDHLRARLEEGEALLRGEKDLTVALAAYLDVGVRSSGRVSAQFVNDVENSDATRVSFDAYQQARADRLSRARPASATIKFQPAPTHHV